jgi:spore coat protein U-like protein
MAAHRLAWRAAFSLALAFGAGTAQQAGAQTLSISAVVLSRNSCTFRGTLPALQFVGIDPASASAATASTGWTLRCTGSSAIATWASTADAGLHSPAPGVRRMRHGTVATEFIEYSLTVPASGTAAKNVDTPYTIGGSIAPGAFQNALPGTYSDTVRVTLTP